jgi:phosphotransferase system enzyme I (PtsI)
MTGIGVSKGIGIGQVQRIHVTDLSIPEYALSANEIEHEITRYIGAVSRAKAQLALVKEEIPLDTPDDIAAFIDTHLLMMDDRTLTEGVVGLIRQQQINAESALRKQKDALVAVFDAMEDPYLRTRRDDVEHVVVRIQRVLLKQDRPVVKVGNQPTVIVADDITPADILLFGTAAQRQPNQGVVALVTEFGGPLSHTAILARSLGIPAIVGLREARKLFKDGEWAIIDGDSGQALASPDDLALAFFRKKQDKQRADREALEKIRDQPAVTKDHHSIRLLANIEQVEDAQHAANHGAEGVGLYRTEFLYMNRAGLPSEEEQYQAYASVIAGVDGPITIRTLDLGADKQVDSGRNLGPTPNNPALGLRAIRLCLREPELLRIQARALLRAARHGRVKIMLPMISSVQEFRQAKALIQSAEKELQQEGLPHADVDSVDIGAMIEVPAAALAAPMLARECDFFSIGTNDLIQYTLAIDRVDDEVNYLYDPLHPAVLRLIRATIEAGEIAGIPVSMCGEMAGDIRYTRLLLGLGLTEFSMHPANVLEVKKQVLEADLRILKKKALRLLTSADAEEYRELLAGLVE